MFLYFNKHHPNNHHDILMANVCSTRKQNKMYIHIKVMGFEGINICDTR